MENIVTSSPTEINSNSVHFAASVDWDEEQRRSNLGFERRWKKKEAKRMAERQKELRLITIVNILRDQRHHHALTKMFSDEDVFVKHALWDVVQSGARTRPGRKEPSSDKFAGLLANFAKLPLQSLTLGKLSRTQRQALETLNVRDRFTHEFRAAIAAGTVVTSDEDGTSEEEGGENRRDARQLASNSRASRELRASRRGRRRR